MHATELAAYCTCGGLMREQHRPVPELVREARICCFFGWFMVFTAWYTIIGLVVGISLLRDAARFRAMHYRHLVCPLCGAELP